MSDDAVVTENVASEPQLDREEKFVLCGGSREMILVSKMRVPTIRIVLQ